MNTDSEIWLMSFYRLSEINGAQFFAKLAARIQNPQLQHNLTRHFAEEAQHAYYWSDAIEAMGAKPVELERCYQDAYFERLGVPMNIMEVLAITQIFEKRVIQHYASHLKRQDTHPIIAQTLLKIIKEERWHLQWVREALQALEPQFGRETIDETLARYDAADKAIYAQLELEQRQRLAH